RASAAAAPTRACARASGADSQPKKSLPFDPIAVEVAAEQEPPLAARPETDLELIAVVAALLELLDRPGRDPAERTLASRVLQQRAQHGPSLGADVAGRGRLEDDRQRLVGPFLQTRREQLDVVAADELGRVPPENLDRL